MSELVEVTANDQGAMVLKTLQGALDKGVDADSLEKILSMQERILDRKAEQAYYEALRMVQSEMPVIEKNKINQQTNSKYSDMEQILKVATPIITGRGFATSFGVADSPLPEHVRVICDVMHSQGHSRQYHTDIPLDMTGMKGSPNKTKVHGTGSAMSYGQRYLIKLIFNINTGDDDDGNSAGGDERSAIEISNEWIRVTGIWRDIIPSLHQIKENIALNELQSAAEVWGELTKEEKAAVWNPAPSKGGILTTQERTVMKSNEWAEARNAITGFDKRTTGE